MQTEIWKKLDVVLNDRVAFCFVFIHFFVFFRFYGKKENFSRTSVVTTTTKNAGDFEKKPVQTIFFEFLNNSNFIILKFLVFTRKSK